MNCSGKGFRRLRDVLVFLLVCLLLQGGLYLAFSEPCADRICAWTARLTAEAVDLQDEGLLEYHAMRHAVSDARLVVVGFDSSVAGSGALMVDFLRFVTRSVDVDSLVVDYPADIVEALNEYLDGEHDYPEDFLLDVEGATAETLALVEGVAEINHLLPPMHRFTFSSAEEAWSKEGEPGAPILYLADRAVGAGAFADVCRSLADCAAVVTVDVRCQDAVPDDGARNPSAFILPAAGQAGSVWLIETEKLSVPMAYYRFVVTHVNGGKQAALADLRAAQMGDFSLIAVGREEAEPLS
ncbi:MAG: hypothetical protein IKD37_01610 [Clostridia bacterium]|nr:hypothetical protein [Clostridia bacterium]